MARNNGLISVVNFFEDNENLQGLLKFNLMNHNVEIGRKNEVLPGDENRPITDYDVIALKYYIAKIKEEEYNKNLIEEAIDIISHRYSYHPLLNYLNSLKWDGINRINTWLHDYLGAEQNSYTRCVGRKILCGAVARAFFPGCKFDYMMILEGEQGIKKSTLLEILCGEWYIDTDLSDMEQRKDLVDTLSNGWIVEIGDLAGFNKADIKQVRAFITRRVDKVRLPYRKRVQDFKKQCVLIGTHNPSGDNEYLKDDSGNRRFWPVECIKADCELMKKNRDQILAEAVHLYREGEQLFLDEEKDITALQILSNIHIARESTNPFRKEIEEYVGVKNEVTSMDIIKNAFKINLATASANNIRGKQTLIGIWMRKNKWRKDGDAYFRTEYSPKYIQTPQQETAWEE